MTTVVVTDSTSDLPDEVLEREEIDMVPLTVHFGDREYLDRRELSPARFWSLLESSEALPETAAPGVGAFREAFLDAAERGARGVVAVCVSSELSATSQSARLAAEAVADRIQVEVIDSRAVSMALGMVALEAARAARNGADPARAARAAREAVPLVNVVAALDTLEFLKRGGRVGSVQALVGGLLDLKPLISLRDGVVIPVDRVRTRSKALAAITERIAELGDRLAELVVLHGAATDVGRLVDAIEERIGRRPPVAELGPVVGTHAGPGVIGVAYRLSP